MKIKVKYLAFKIKNEINIFKKSLNEILGLFACLKNGS